MRKKINKNYVKLNNYKHPTISNYHLLPVDALKADGWLEEEDIKPVYDELTHYLKLTGYTELNGKLIFNYEVLPIPEPEPTTEEVLADLIQTLANKGVIY